MIAIHGFWLLIPPQAVITLTAYFEERGSLACIVKTIGGEPLPGAIITLTAEGSVQSRTEVSDESDRCRMNDLLADTYQLTVTMTGFKRIPR